MAEQLDLPTLPSVSPKKIKQLIYRLGRDEAFRKKFTEATEAAHGYKNLRTIDPEFPGPFSHYYLGLQYVLHDPRAKSLYDSYYDYLSEPRNLEFACSELAKKEEIMSNLDKGVLYEAEDVAQIKHILLQPDNLSQQEQKIEEVLKKTIKKKEEEHKSKFVVPQKSSGAPKAANVTKVSEAGNPTENNVASNEPPKGVTIPVNPSTVQIPPPISVKADNPASFKFKQALNTVSPSVSSVGKRLSHAAFLFYKRHPITARAALGGGIGAIISTVYGWPFSPASGAAAGVMVSALVPRAMDIISPPPREEPEVFEDDEMNEFADSLPSGSVGFAPDDEDQQSSTSRHSLPGRNMMSRARNLRKLAQMGRNLKNIRAAASVARAVPLLANPYVLIALVVLLVLLILIVLLIFLFSILPTNSLLNPLGDSILNSDLNSQVRIIKSGPSQVANGENIQYSIQVSNQGTNAASAEITDNIPEGTEYVDSNPKGTVSGNTVKWSLTNIQSSSPQTIKLEVKPTKNDIWVINEVSAIVKGVTAPGSGPVSGSGCPDTRSNMDGFSCKYLNPSIDLFDTAITQEGKDRYVNTYGNRFVSAGKGDLAEFRRRVDYIVQQSQESGLNPGIFLGYWRSENAFGTLGGREFGCAGDGFYEEIHCALGIKEFSNPVKNPIANCARSKDANSQACKALQQMRQSNGFDNEHPIKYPIATFDDFAEAHGPYGHLTGGLPTNCTNTYNILLEVSKEVGMCKPQSTSPTAPGGSTTPGSSGVALTCPVEQARISCGTAENPSGACGHGGIGYGACSAPPYATCPYSAQLRKAIDVIPAKGGNAPVFAPFVNGTESVEWTRTQEPIAINGGSWGYKVLYSATFQGKALVLDLTHINSSVTGSKVKSGETIGSIYPHTDGNGIGHLHTALSVNGVWVEAVTEAKMCGN